MYGAIPPIAETVAVPFLDTQVAAVLEEVTTINVFCPTLSASTNLQPFTSVMVTV